MANVQQTWATPVTLTDKDGRVIGYATIGTPVDHPDWKNYSVTNEKGALQFYITTKGLKPGTIGTFPKKFTEQPLLTPKSPGLYMSHDEALNAKQSELFAVLKGMFDLPDITQLPTPLMVEGEKNISVDVHADPANKTTFYSVYEPSEQTVSGMRPILSVLVPGSGNIQIMLLPKPGEDSVDNARQEKAHYAGLDIMRGGEPDEFQKKILDALIAKYEFPGAKPVLSTETQALLDKSAAKGPGRAQGA